MRIILVKQAGDRLKLKNIGGRFHADSVNNSAAEMLFC